MLDSLTQNRGTPKTHYSIEAPGVLWSNAEYSVAITLFAASEPCEINIKLFGGVFKLEKFLEVQPMSTSLLRFQIPNLNIDVDYYLEAESLKGVSIKEKVKLCVKQRKPLTYIQLDKQAYKRGDDVDFRILFLEPDYLRPAKIENSIKVLIKTDDNVIYEHNDIEVSNGLHMAKWHIPEELASGTYSIEVTSSNTSLKTKSFEIIDFTAPKFDIKIVTARTVPYEQKQIIVGIEAKYGDNTPVNGECKMEIECVGGFFSGVYIEKSLPIFGKTHETIIDLIEDLKIDKSFVEETYFHDASIMIRVAVSDEKTGCEEALTDLITIKRNGSNPKERVEHIKSKISDEDQENENISNEKAIRIIPPKGEPSVGEPLTFTIQLNKPTNCCVYFVIGRGTILKSELIEVKDYQIPLTCQLNPTFKCVPRTFILAYFIHDDVLYFDEAALNLPREFPNKLVITATETANPGDLISFEVQTAPNSEIAFLAVDEKSVHLNSQNDLNSKDVFNDLFYIRSQIMNVVGSGRYPGIASGLFSLTNATIDGFEICASNTGSTISDPEHMETVRVMPRIVAEKYKKNIELFMQKREQVFGNWIFAKKKVNENGYLKFETKVPNKPTNWLLTAFAISTEKGFAMTREPLRIKTSQSTPTSTVHPIEAKILNICSRVSKFVFDNYTNGLYKTSFEIDTSKDVEPVEVSFSITENLFGPIIAKLADHAGVMYCTGHLHMTTVIPNVNVLEYLDHLNELDSEFALSIKNRFPEAIERELSERRDRDGSFSWFGHDPTGSPHITSLVLQAFQRVSKYVEVDPNVIERGLSYLVSNQLDTGEIAKEVQPYEYPFEKNVGVGLTSMVLLAFLQNEDVKCKYKSFIDKAFNYIVSKIDVINCVYDLALAFYAMQLAKHYYADTLKVRLFKLAQRDCERDYIWWPYSILSKDDPDVQPPVTELEVTSYILLGLLETEPVEDLLPIIKWMLSTGIFANESMDRAIALDAILKMAAKSGAALATIDLDFTAYCTDGTFNGNILLTPENSSRVITQVLPLNTERIQFETKDKGTFFGNITYRYREM